MKTSRLGTATALLLLSLAIPCALWAGGEKEKAGGTVGTQAVAAGKYKEAPMLAKLVSEGKLPSVDKRLPEEPLVVKGEEGIGKYGGTWYRFNDHPRMFCWEPLVKVDIDGKQYPNLATSWEISPDYTRFTFHLRRGIKWSDGMPFTSEDIMFYWNDIILSKEYPREMPVGDGQSITAPDAYTIVIGFSKPQMTFMEKQSTQWGGYGFTMASWPKHYLKQFHPKYAGKEAMDKLLKEASMATWAELMEARYWVERNPDIPVITPWKQTSQASDPLQTYVRNPYYWKVDPEGNQLPYIDYAERPQKADHEVGILKAAAGEIDFTGEAYTIADLPILSDNARKGNYRIVKVQNTYAPTSNCLYVNQDYSKDPEVGDVLRNLSFRKALSVAIKRQEINEFTSLGQSVPCQATVPPTHPAGSQELYTYMTQYDPEQARKLLDEAGLSKKDSEGFRLLPSGKKFTLVISPRSNPNIKCAEILKKHFEDVGLRISISTEDSTFWFQNKNTGLHQVSMYSLGNGNPQLNDTWWMPVNGNCYWAPLSGQYVATKGSSGVKPSGEIAEIAERFQQFSSEIDPKKRAETMKWLVDRITRNLYMIGTVSSPPVPVIVKNNFHGIPEKQTLYSTRVEVWEYCTLWKEGK